MQPELGNHYFAAAGVDAAPDAYLAAAEQLAGCQSCQDCKKKKLKAQFGSK